MGSVLVPARRHDPEWMDRTDNPRHEVEGALDDIRAVNRFLRGSSILRDAVRPYLESAPAGAELTILDVGTGGGDLPAALADEARRLNRKVRIVGVDRDPAAIDYARRRVAGRPEIEIMRADAAALPIELRSFDLVVASMFLHHFGHRTIVRFLAEFLKISRRAVLVNDLRRHWVPWAFIAATSRLTRRHPMFVHDAPLSVLRGFTDTELRCAGEEAGASTTTVRRRFPYRLLLVLTPGRVDS